MFHFNSQTCKHCHAQLAIGGKPTAKKGRSEVLSVWKYKSFELHVNNVATSHCWLLFSKIINNFVS